MQVLLMLSCAFVVWSAAPLAEAITPEAPAELRSVVILENVLICNTAVKIDVQLVSLYPLGNSISHRYRIAQFERLTEKAARGQDWFGNIESRTISPCVWADRDSGLLNSSPYFPNHGWRSAMVYKIESDKQRMRRAFLRGSIYYPKLNSPECNIQEQVTALQRWQSISGPSGGFSGNPGQSGLQLRGPGQHDGEKGDYRGADSGYDRIILVKKYADASEADTRHETMGRIFVGGVLAGMCLAVLTILK